jgi:hypothetical protein
MYGAFHEHIAYNIVYDIVYDIVYNIVYDIIYDMLCTCNTPSSIPLGGNENLPCSTKIGGVKLSDRPRGGLHTWLHTWLVRRRCLWTATTAVFRVREHHKDSVSDTVLLVARLKMKLLLSERHHSFACAVGRGSCSFKPEETATSSLRRRTTLYVWHATSYVHTSTMSCTI